MGYWSEVRDNLNKWPQALGKVVVAAGAGAVAGGTVGASALGVGSVPGLIAGGVVAGGVSLLAQGLDTFFIEPSDQSEVSRRLGYFDQQEFDSKVALPDAQTQLANAQQTLADETAAKDKALEELDQLKAKNEKLQKLVDSLPEKTVLIISGYLTGQIADDDQDYKVLKSEDEYNKFKNTTEYKSNLERFGISDRENNGSRKVVILGLEKRLKVIGVEPERIRSLASEIKEIAEELREEIQAETKEPEPPKVASPKPAPEKAEPKPVKSPETTQPSESAFGPDV